MAGEIHAPKSYGGSSWEPYEPKWHDKGYAGLMKLSVRATLHTLIFLSPILIFTFLLLLLIKHL